MQQQKHQNKRKKVQEEKVGTKRITRDNSLNGRFFLSKIVKNAKGGQCIVNRS